MKLDQSSVLHDTDGFRSTPEGCDFSTKSQFQLKRLSEMTVCQSDPKSSQNLGERGHFRSKEPARSARTQLDGHFIASFQSRLRGLRDCRLAMSTDLRRYHILS
jgi:hypothetical protein